MINDTTGPVAPREFATARLEASRASLVSEFVAQAERGAVRAGIAGAGSVVSPRPRGRRSLAVLALDAVDAASGPNPVAATLNLACATAQDTLAPVARRHPWALIGGAALLGAMLTFALPWRGLLRAAVVGPAAGPLVGRLLPPLLWLATGRSETQPRSAASRGDPP